VSRFFRHLLLPLFHANRESNTLSSAGGAVLGMRPKVVWVRTRDLLSNAPSTAFFHYLKSRVLGYSSTTAGSFIVTGDPLPSSLSTSTVPAIISQKWRVMANPKPVPPNRRLVEASAYPRSRKGQISCAVLTPAAPRIFTTLVISTDVVIDIAVRTLNLDPVDSHRGVMEHRRSFGIRIAFG
jgi:hypothetical protein